MKTQLYRFASALVGLGAGLGLLGAVPAPALAGAGSGVMMTVDTLQSTEWRNPRNSVHIRALKCGTNLCGTVSWASDKAIADAKRGGATGLIGTQIFRNFKDTGKGSFRGKVYVPDIQQTFSGTITFTDENTMVGKGCVLFGIICKSQTWTRIR